MVLSFIKVTCAALFMLQSVHAGTETLKKPFTGAYEVAWESLAAQQNSLNSRRSRSIASAASAASASCK